MLPRILLAEDNGPLAATLAQFLASRDYAVTATSDGTAALRMLEETPFDLLLLDLRLPGTNGVDVLRAVRRNPRLERLPVIVMSGVYKGEKYAAGARSLGVRHYLEKPFRREELLAAIDAELAGLKPSLPPSDPFDLLGDIYRNRRTGQLLFPQGSPILFLGGDPVSFITRDRDDFSPFLLERGKIRVADLKLRAEHGDGRIFFTETGLIGYDELQEESRLFLTYRLAEFLESEETRAEFRDALPAPELPLASLSLPRVLYEGVRQIPPQRFVSFLDGNGNSYPCPTPLYYRLANLVDMRPDDIEVLDRLDGSRTLREIADNGPSPGSLPLCRFLAGLGMIAFTPSPTTCVGPDFPQSAFFNRPLEEPDELVEVTIGFDDLVGEVSDSVELAVGDEGMAAPLSSAEIGFEQEVQRDFAFIKDKNYYELFGLNPGTFSFDALKEAYFAKTRQYSPDKFMELAGTTLNTAQEVLSHYANAYATLSSVVAKERYDEMLNADRVVGLTGQQDDRLQAEIQFQSGKVFLEMGEYDNAERSLQDAYTLDPDNPQNCAYLAWAVYRNPANRNSRSAHERARTLLSRSLQYGREAEAYSFRGWMLLDEGRDGLAEGEFQKALKINPKEPLARKGLKQIADKREAEKKGIFRKIFG